MKLHYYYDGEADVLYFSKGKPSQKEVSQETPDDVVIRFNPTSKEVVGFTVLNFAKRLRHKEGVVSLPLEIQLNALR
jgi:uncharacterized protein YuzE